MLPDEIAEALKALKGAWKNLPPEQRILTESTQGIDLYPQYQHLITGIDAILLSEEGPRRIARVPIALWISYLACVSVKRFIFTAWILNEHIPGFIDKTIDYSTLSDQEYPRFVFNRLERLTRRTLVNEMMKPEILEKAINRRTQKEDD